MSDLSQDDGAEVVVLRVPAQAYETRAREIGAQFPRWHVCYSDWADTWDAYREGEEPYFGPGAVAGRAFMESAYNASDLVALLENQARVDIAVEFRNGGCSRARAAGVPSALKGRTVAMVQSSSSCTVRLSGACCGHCGRAALVGQCCTVRDSLAGWALVCLS